MSLKSVVWVNALSGISPIAKLVAIDLASVSGGNEIGTRHLTDLAEFACCTPDDVQLALVELGNILSIETSVERVQATFPTREDRADVAVRRAREKDYKANRLYYLYVISKGDKIKVGISRQLAQRLEQLRTSFPLAIDVLLTAKGPFQAIRRAEMEIHEALKDAALGGEYFGVTRDRALKAANTALERRGVSTAR